MYERIVVTGAWHAPRLHGSAQPLKVEKETLVGTWKLVLVSNAEEKAETFSTSLAYASTFNLSGDRVIHHVEAATDPNRVNKDLVRRIVKLEGDRVTLRTINTVDWDDGVRYAYQELVWDRVR